MALASLSLCVCVDILCFLLNYYYFILDLMRAMVTTKRKCLKCSKSHIYHISCFTVHLADINCLMKYMYYMLITFFPSLLLSLSSFSSLSRSIGMPVLRVVKLTNPTNSLTLQLISISGTLPDFHTSFFVDKVQCAWCVCMHACQARTIKEGQKRGVES